VGTSFFLPNGHSALQMMMFATFLLDSDIGGMFLHFPMNQCMRPYIVVDIHHLKEVFKGTYLEQLSHIIQCVMLFMGCGSSPYLAVRFYYLKDEFTRHPKSY
jgi:hypothetical protein